MQICKDEKINIAFNHFHENLVNEVIGFCRAYGITDIDEVVFNIDHLQESIKYGSWCPATDSSLVFYNKTRSQRDITENSVKPFLNNC